MGSNILDADKFCKCFSRHKDIYELPQTPEVINIFKNFYKLLKNIDFL